MIHFRYLVKLVVLSSLFIFTSITFSQIQWSVTVLNENTSEARVALYDYQIGRVAGIADSGVWQSSSAFFWPIPAPFGQGTVIYGADDSGLSGLVNHSVGHYRAAFWAWDRFADLHPSHGFVNSAAYGAGDGLQVGAVYPDQSSFGMAACWGGSEESLQVVHPLGYRSTRLNSAGFGQMVGSALTTAGRTHAGLWDQATGAFTDLTPDSYIANAMAIDDCQQYGYNKETSNAPPIACRWSGSSESQQYLQPESSYQSQMWFAHNGFGVGTFNSAPQENLRAGIWNTRNLSFLDLHSLFPPHSGYYSSEAWGVYTTDHELWAVGFAWIRVGSSSIRRAVLWHGRAEGGGSIHKVMFDQQITF